MGGEQEVHDEDPCKSSNGRVYVIRAGVHLYVCFCM